MRFSACIEWLFAEESPDFAGRIALAKRAGLDAVEFWRHSNKDLQAVRAALDKAHMPLAGIVCDPIVPLTDRTAHLQFLAALEGSIAAARMLGAPMMIAQAGNVVPGLSREVQHDAIVAALREAALRLKGTGVVLALEPLNDLVDHKGYYLTSTLEGLDIIDEVGAPEIRLLYDIYHAAVMGEPVELLAGRVDRIAHVHLADHPGRGAPGTGSVDLIARLRWLEAEGYSGLVGLEYRPNGPTKPTLGFREALK